MAFELKTINEILELNPTTKLAKKTIAKKVAMEHIKEHQKYIDNFDVTEFKGGSKFKNNDVLVARITPCLENGKTAFVDILEKEEVAFGSTEYFVIRNIINISDSHYLYYLMRTPIIRETLIKSMTGTSGRQRAQKEALLNFQLPVPSLQEQIQIARTLSNIDDKIRLNQQIVANLEELSQTLFKRWFVDFEFPDEEGNPYKSSGGVMKQEGDSSIPIDWDIKSLETIMEITSGKRPKSKKDTKEENYTIPIIGASQTMGYTDSYLFDSRILVMGRVGTHGVIQRYRTKCWPSDNTLVMQSIYYNLLYEFLNTVDYKSLNRGSTQPLLTQSDIKNLKLALPNKFDKMDSFELELDPLLNMIFSLKIENNKLTNLRDALLPKLMSGEIELSDELEVNEHAELLQ